MKFEIKNRWSGELIFSIEADSWKVAVEAAIKSKADLSEADLSKADLSKADLSKADLSEADLSWANLSKADLSEADLSEADLSWADLSWANLSKADLSKANLRVIKHDVWGVLLQAQGEVAFVRQALIEGKVDGSVYSGECSCLCGTLAKAQGIDGGDKLPFADSYSPAERFFLAIRKGDTPETNSVSKLVVQWIDEFLSLTAKKV